MPEIQPLAFDKHPNVKIINQEPKTKPAPAADPKKEWTTEELEDLKRVTMQGLGHEPPDPAKEGEGNEDDYAKKKSEAEQRAKEAEDKAKESETPKEGDPDNKAGAKPAGS